MRTLFAKRMDDETEANAHKGDWDMWNPTKEEWLWEFEYHKAKLQKAISDGDRRLICEYSADVGNLAEKAFNVFGKPDVCIDCNGEGVVCVAIGDEGMSRCELCSGTGVKEVK